MVFVEWHVATSEAECSALGLHVVFRPKVTLHIELLIVNTRSLKPVLHQQELLHFLLHPHRSQAANSICTDS